MTLTPAPPSTPRVGVVVVNWNSWSYTLECLAKLGQSQGVNWRAYIVDNASTDGSCEHLGDLGPNAELICAPRNLGWTGGNNLGIQRALADGCDYLCFLNNDAAVAPDTLARLVEAAQTPQGAAAVLGCVVLTQDGRDHEFAGARVNPETGIPFWPREIPLTQLVDRPLVESAGVCGAAFLAPRAVLASIGLFDDDFYVFFDETDWCARAARGGVKMLVVRDAVVRHVGRATIGQGSPLEEYFMTRNQLLFAERHCTLPQRIAGLRELIWRIRRLDGPPSPWSFFRTTPRTRAARRGMFDYLFRRFGDCPPIIRQLTTAFKQAAA